MLKKSDEAANVEGAPENRLPILLVEDEPDQVLLVRAALEGANVPFPLQTVNSGEEAVAYLAGEGKFADRTVWPFPALLLLDLKMPGMSGFGVLRWLQRHPETRQRLIVTAFSSTQSSKEIEVAYELGVQFFLPKSSVSNLSEQVRLLMKSRPSSSGRDDLV